MVRLKLLSSLALIFQTLILRFTTLAMQYWRNRCSDESHTKHWGSRSLKKKREKIMLKNKKRRKMISSKISQPDFINPDCTCRICKGLQTVVLPYIIVANHLFKPETLHRQQSYKKKFIRGKKFQLVGFKFIKILDLKGIQGKEIRIWGKTKQTNKRNKGNPPEFVKDYLEYLKLLLSIKWTKVKKNKYCHI